ncbi:ornithine cyclodeaminase family protein [Halomarina salina]|uniref:Ornithine cyclodeaminase family protein n=1 Tax=Halomarina salina TaxID=1872699 RepID=A0ABD5RMW8_9EURY|nr:ornithine cyclodeaminase family protein [Halomarina salina]
MVLVLSDDDVRGVLDLDPLAEAVEDALVAQTRGAVERPERPHYPVGAGVDGETGPDGGGCPDEQDARGTALAMPAYVHGAPYFATKLASVHPANRGRSLPTLHAQLVLADATTGAPVSVLGATTLTNARTGCIGGLAARDLAAGPVTLGVLGAGAQARWQTRAVAALADLERVRVYSPSDSKHDCVADLRAEGLTADAVDSPAAAVEGATVVVTATTSADPVVPANAVGPGTLVVGIGAYEASMQELPAALVERADRLYADVPEEAVETGDVAATDRTVADLVPLGALFDGTTERATAGPVADDEVVVVESVGSAVMDVAAATVVYEAATEAGVGTDQPL